MTPNFHCDHCNREFDTINALRQHRRDKHQIISPKCHLCGKVFDSPHALNQHLQSPRHNSNVRSENRPLFLSPQQRERTNLIREIHNNVRQKRELTPLGRERRKEHYERNRTIIVDTTLKCPPHKFDIQHSTLVGFGPGNGGEQRRDVEMVERCVYCGRTRLDIEQSDTKS